MRNGIELNKVKLRNYFCAIYIITLALTNIVRENMKNENTCTVILEIIIVFLMN